MMQIAEMAGRLRRLAKRREDDGIYTDANLCEEVATHLEATGEAKPVAVKALEWRESPIDHEADYAESIFGEWAVWSIEGRAYYRAPDRTAGTFAGNGSRDVAKAAAQVDFERRILSCLAAPVPATNAARPLNSGEVEAIDDVVDRVAMLHNRMNAASIPTSFKATIVDELKDIHRRLRAALSSAPSTPEGWRSIETAPKDGAEILVAWEHRVGNGHTIFIGCWKDRYGWVDQDRNPFSSDPDLWSPIVLPTPPAGGGDAAR